MIAFLLMLAAVIAGAELLSLRRGLDGVEYDVRPSKAVAEPGEPLQLVTVVTNRKRRFLPFIRLVEDVPDAMASRASCGRRTSKGRRGALRGSVYMMPRQRLTRRTDFTLPAGGAICSWARRWRAATSWA